MIKQVNVANVIYRGDLVGSVLWSHENSIATFEFTNDFKKHGVPLSPIIMPMEDKKRIYSFPHLDKHTFKGLPGLLSDSLPDKFGNKIIDSWLAKQGRPLSSFSPVERLCYIGNRGMGALEYQPTIYKFSNKPHSIEVSEMVDIINKILNEKKTLNVKINGNDKEIEKSIKEILRVGTSAGGARPKAIIAFDPITNDVKSGQLELPSNYEHWIIKFDGISDEFPSKKKSGDGLIEFAYSKMAKQAGINMMPCMLLRENGRSHFMTKRFDRDQNKKIHTQTLSAIAHIDFNQPGICSYEEVFSIMRKLRLSKEQQTEQFKRMIFNILSRNHDDHAKNISFIMDSSGKWSLSPAYDLVYSYKEGGEWTSMHQMSLNGKRDNFNLNDIIKISNVAEINKPLEIMEEVASSLSQWKKISKDIGLSPEKIDFIEKNFRIIKES